MFKFIDYTAKYENVEYKKLIKFLQNKVVINHICYEKLKPVDVIKFLHTNNHLIEKILHSDFENYTDEENKHFVILFQTLIKNVTRKNEK